ncbi:hypothetical protein F2P56_010552 [Juglans regia]|uniref:Uncharacterized protein LOC108990261 n=2 Tax=Juglans regia TaxID=51240 RepID=A0A2I4EK41_JUGRE|nr:uncharacterized protein LOC108990261 [Juglans regia]KAF5469998.1 hypothetical protein F2P56_010552 [Juglans regia]
MGSPAPAVNAFSKQEVEYKELIIDFTPELEPPWPECCIYRVPKRLREVQPMAYTPRLVSIGPFHHRSEELKDMERQKFIYLRDFCNRTGKSIEYLARIIRPLEMKIRCYYSETFLHMSSEGFANMIVLDAMFILELFWRKSQKSMAQKDYMLCRPCMERGIQHDLLLLENQIPFFVLEELYFNVELNVGHQNGEPKTKKPTLLELSCGFFGHLDYDFKPESKKCFYHDLVGCFRTSQNPSPSSPEPEKFENDEVNHIKDLVNRFPQDRSSPNFIEVKHFTDLVRYFFCPPSKEGQNSKKCGHVKQCFPDWVGCCCPRQEDPKPSSPERKVPMHFTDSVSHEFFPPPEPKHCTDLVRRIFRPSNRKREGSKPEKKRTKPLCTATKLDEAGLKIARPDSERPLLQIQFRENNCECLIKRCPVLNLSWLLSCLPCLKSTCLVHMQRFLEVPPLRVDDKTEGLFRNLMALEQCHYPSETYICDYIVLLDDLITTKADVTLLVEKKIIVNELGSSAAVTKLVNNLGLEIEESGNHYEELCEKLNEYYENNWNRLVGTLTKVYFSDFFKGTATVAGIIVLGLTLWNFQRLLRWSLGKY